MRALNQGFRQDVDRIRVEGLIVDFVGVLTVPPNEFLANFCRSEGIPADTFARLMSGNGPVPRHVADLERGTISQIEFNELIAAHLDVPATNLVGRLTATLEPENAMLHAMERLRQLGIKVAVLSNSWGLWPHNIYESWQLESRFDSVMYSEKFRMRKPESQALYALAAEKLGLEPSLCAFVDDTAGNLEPARRLGMTAIQHASPSETVMTLERLVGCSAGSLLAG